MSKREARAQHEQLAARIAAIRDRAAVTSYESVGNSPKREERLGTFRPAIVTIGYGEKIPVVIKDISDGGAHIEYFQMRHLPDVVHIEEARSGLDTDAAVMWQDLLSCGLQFIPR